MTSVRHNCSFLLLYSTRRAYFGNICSELHTVKYNLFTRLCRKKKPIGARTDTLKKHTIQFDQL